MTALRLATPAARTPRSARVPRCAGAWPVLAALLASASGAAAQDLAPALPEGPQRSAACMLERGLPPEADGLTLAAGVTRWFALPSLESRSIAMNAGWHLLRVAAAVSQTGDERIGWSGAHLALGRAGPDAGAALRFVARRDNDDSLRAPGTRAGFEAGGGAWVRAAAGWTLWASAPQLWTDGAPPPLARALQAGVRAESGALSAWIAIEASAPGLGARGARTIGLACSSGPVAAWAQVEDVPLRASVGLAASVRSLRVEARLDQHPVLAETTRLAVSWNAGASP